MIRHAITVTTDGSGDATGYTPTIHGFVRAIRYVPPGANELATGASVVFSAAETGLAILTQASLGTSAREWQPRSPTHGSADGAAALYAAAGTAVNGLIPVASEAVKLVVASGGAAKSGTFHVYVEGR